MRYEKKIMAAVCTISAITLAGCAAVSIQSDPTTAPSASASSSTDSIPNPLIPCETAEEAGKTAGFEFTVPEKIEGYEIVGYLAVKDSFAEANYMSEDDEMMIRKGEPVDGNDISGDYTEYSESNTITMLNGDKQIVVSTRGEDGLYRIALWGDGEYSYAISSNNGLDAATLEKIMQAYWAAGTAATATPMEKE